MMDLSWDPKLNEFVFGLIAITMGFNLYWFISKSNTVRKKWIAKYGEERAQARMVFFGKYNGLIWMGVVPAILAYFIFDKSPLDYGFHFNFTGGYEALYWVLGLSAVIWLMNFLARGRETTLKQYPQVRTKVWSRSLLFQVLLGWASYLLGYEFIFRGLLLYASVPILGPWGAIILTVAFYSVTHIPKGSTEAFGSILMGFMLAVITLRTGNIWAAYIIHISLAWSNVIFTLKSHPDMQLIRKAN